jgi:hypothetical protein
VITKDGQVVATVPSGQGSVTLPCMPGRYCVQCRKSDGTLTAPVCCTVEDCGGCPTETLDTVRCVRDPATGRLVIQWSLLPNVPAACCDRFIVTKDGVVVAAVPATQTSIELPCMPGRYCVQCVLPDGTLTAPKCCEVTAADCGGKPNIVRGDCDGDGSACTSVNDAVLNLNFNFLGGRRPPCLAACDTDGDGIVRGTVNDAIYDLNHCFLGGRPPPAPYPDCGPCTDLDIITGCEVPPAVCNQGG